MTKAPLKILLSAGEASGDRLGAGLARALRAASPGIELVGMGGAEMEAAGVRLVRHASDVSVVGIVEVLRHLPEIRAAMARLERAIREERPDLVVPIDFPDFNLRLAARARRAEVPVVYYVGPQVWAWRQRRVATIRALVRRMLVLFPFELPFYQARGVPVSFVGHPAAAGRARASRAEVLPRLGFAPDRPLVALLPGSRVDESARNLPALLDAAENIAREHPGAQFVVPEAGSLPPGHLERAAGARAALVRFHRGDYPALLEVADAGAVASGTATLDAALAGLPFVAVYRMQPLTYRIARLLVKVEHIALPNLVAGERVVPELVQGEFTGEAVARIVLGFLSDPKAAAAIRARLARIRETLAGDEAFERAAEAVLREV